MPAVCPVGGGGGGGDFLKLQFDWYIITKGQYCSVQLEQAVYGLVTNLLYGTKF